MVKTKSNKRKPGAYKEIDFFLVDVKNGKEIKTNKCKSYKNMWSEENVNKVPKKQRDRWSIREKKTFNRFYGHVFNNKRIYLHPKFNEKLMTDELWKTTARNIAWMVADEIKIFKRAISEM